MALVDEMTRKICKSLDVWGYKPEQEYPAGENNKRVDVHFVLDPFEYDCGIEIKTSRGDLNSGYGLNFCFDFNYIFVPQKLACYVFGLKYMKYIPNYVGVLIYDARHNIAVAEPALCNANDYFMPFHDAISPFAINIDNKDIYIASKYDLR